MKFCHTSDLHLAKPFGRFDEILRGRLQEARHGAISRIAAAARRSGADIVLVAGDTFDAETPPPQVVRHALRAFADEADIRWVLLPGNHDSLAASDLWRRISSDRPDNLILALTPGIIAVGALDILAAPPTSRNPGRDLTEWMEQTERDASRVGVGLAHGSIQDFGDEAGEGIIPPDRAERAGIDYLALGDWHGTMKIGSRCHYSGTPEPDSFKHDHAGILVVEVDAPGSTPKISKERTQSFEWTHIVSDLQPGDDIRERLGEDIPDALRNRDTLLSATFTGRTSLSDRADLESTMTAMADDFAHLDLDLGALETDQAAGDLDHIETGGALRAAAEALAGRAADAAQHEEDRRRASAALARLYVYAMEVET